MTETIHNVFLFDCKKEGVMKKGYFLTFLLVVSLILSFFSYSWAVEAPKPKGYPDRPIEVVVQYGAGGGTDIFVRSLMRAAKDDLGVKVNVTNLPGASGVKASNYALSQPADGYTIYAFSPGQIINTVFGRENYKDFTPLCQVQQDITMFHSHPDSKYKTFQDVINDAKKNPGKVSFGGAMAASPDQVIAMLMSKQLGIEINYIPFDKAPKSHAALLGGHLDILYEEPGVIMSLLDAKKLRPLLALSEERLARFPDVPIGKEFGTDVTMGRWRGLAMKKGTSPEIVEWLASVLHKAERSKAYQDFASKKLLDVRPGWKGPKEFGKFWDKEYAMYKEILVDLGHVKK
jgi:putative tricarboxylic transport membrane protein